MFCIISLLKDVVGMENKMSCNNSRSRTANGMGSIRKQKRKRKDGSYYEYWEGRMTIHTDSESKKQLLKTFTGSTQAEVLEKMRRFEITEKKSTTLNLETWLTTWTEEYLTGVKPSTFYLYKRDIELYILPNLGQYSLDELSTTIIQRFYNSLLNPSSRNKPLAPKTIHCIHGVLHQALDQAVSAGELAKNPSSACKLPKAIRKEIVPMEDAQVQLFLEMIHGHPHEYLYKITLFTGLREGEVLGLTWDCVDLKEGRLTVKQQLRKEQKKGGKYYFSSTKNDKSRTLVLSPSVVNLFQCQKEKSLSMMLAADRWEESNLVFTNRNGGILSYRTVYDCLKRIVKKMGCPKLRFHDLRHQYAVISIKNGDDIKTVQGNLGHATAAFTLDVYGHVTDDMKRNSANRMESYLQSFEM